MLKASSPFVASSELKEARDPMVESRRKRERLTAPREILVRKLSQQPFSADLIDVSETGACISPSIRLDAGETVSVRFTGLSPLLAKVIWIERHKAGLRFERPFHPSIFHSKFRDRLG